jgi:hypothetical protein
MTVKNKKVEEESKTLKNPLLNKKVTIALIKRHQSSLYKDIDMSTLAVGGSKSFMCPTNRVTGKFQDPLTLEERMFLEDLTGDDFSVHKKKDNFYSKKESMVILRKNGRKTESANLELDLSDPYQFIKYKIALINPRVANSWADRNANKMYEFVIIDGEEESKEEIGFSKMAKEVNKYLIKNENSKRKLYDLLRMYGVENTQKHVNYKKVNTDFIFNELYKATLKKSEVSKLHRLIKLGEKDISDKIFIQDAITVGLLNKRGFEFRLVGGDKIGNNETEAIAWFNDKLNQSVKLKFQQDIEEYYSK